MERVYAVGTRTSPLALRQVGEILRELKKVYPSAEVRVAGIDTCGDRDKLTPISTIEGTDFFTRDIDEALLKGEVDFAVHSAKDLPESIKEGLVVAAVTRSVDPYDVLASKNGLELDALPRGAKIGTSSVRRKMQLKEYRDDLQIVDIRGNIGERLEKLYSGDMDAIVIAAAGLIRLGLAEKITQRLPLEVMQPHHLQGSLAIVARKQDAELIETLSVLDSRGAVPSLTR